MTATTPTSTAQRANPPATGLACGRTRVEFLVAVLTGFFFTTDLHATQDLRSFESALQFRSAEQSVWGANQPTLFEPIDVPITNINRPDIDVGGISARQVNNLAYDAWSVLYDSTYASTYGPVYAANFADPFGCAFQHACAHAEANRLATSAARSVAGPAPPRTITEKNGGRLTGDTKLITGLTGGFEVNGGTVRVDYLPNVRTTLGNASANAGGSMTLTSRVTSDNARITTTGIGVNMSLGAYHDFGSHLKLEAYLANVGGPATLTNFGKGYKVEPLFEFRAGDGVVTLDPLGFGTPLSLPNTLTKQFGSTVSPPDRTIEVTVPVFEVTVGVPATAVNPNATVKDGATWRNVIEPVTRTGAGLLGLENSRPLQGTEFARVALDLDSVTLLSGYAVGARAAINTPPLGIPTILGAEGNLLDLDLETFWALRSNYEFAPKLQVTYSFSQAVEIENADGTRVLLSEITVAPEDVVTFLRPDTGVEISTAFTLAGSQFRNLTDFQLQFALSLALVELRMEGVLFSVTDGALTWAEIVDLPNHLFLAEFGLNLGNPINLGRIGSVDGVQFALDGFDTLAGASFQISAVPEPQTWLLFMAGIGMLAGATARTRLR